MKCGVQHLTVCSINLYTLEAYQALLAEVRIGSVDGSWTRVQVR